MNRRISQLYDFELADYFRKRLSVETEIRRFARGSILGSIRGSRLGVQIGGLGFVGTHDAIDFSPQRATNDMVSKRERLISIHVKF